MSRIFLVATVALLLSGVSWNTAAAQKVGVPARGAEKKSPADPDAKRSKDGEATARPEEKSTRPEDKLRHLPAFSAQREAAALSFVKEHHEELADLLAQLKRQDRRQYEKAVRELFRTSERLSNERERDEDRWAISVKLWKLESRIRLMAARLAMDPEDEELLTALREALAEQMDARLERLRLDRRRMVERITRLDLAIERAEQAKEKHVEDSLKDLLQNVTRQRDEAKQRKEKRKPEPASVKNE